MSSREVGIEVGRKKLGDFVTAAQQHGRSVIITRNGTPAAMLVPAPMHLQVRHISVEAIDRGDWRDQAVENWLEAAAEEGYGFSVLATYDQGDVLAVMARDKWLDGDRIVAGERLTLRIDRANPEVVPGDGDMLDIHPGPYDPAQHPVRPGPYDPPTTAEAPTIRTDDTDVSVGGRFRVCRNGSGGISLDWGGGEVDMDADEANQLSTALSQAAFRDGPFREGTG